MTIKTVLQDQRRVLLDLTYRNRLLSLPKKPSSRTIVVHDELGAQVASILLDKKSMSFAPLPGGATEERLSDDELIQDVDEPALTQPDDEIDAASGLASRHTDTKLQTKLKSEHLQKRLLEIYYEARTMLEEQGVNVLYLAMGQLRYGERAGTDDETRTRAGDGDRAAQLGVIIRGPEVLESTRRIDAVILDKTGTVTDGRMSLAQVSAVPGEDADEALALAAAAEAASEHPVAQAIVTGARERGLVLPATSGFSSDAGRGVRWRL